MPSGQNARLARSGGRFGFAGRVTRSLRMSASPKWTVCLGLNCLLCGAARAFAFAVGNAFLVFAFEAEFSLVSVFRAAAQA